MIAVLDKVAEINIRRKEASIYQNMVWRLS